MNYMSFMDNIPSVSSFKERERECCDSCLYETRFYDRRFRRYVERIRQEMEIVYQEVTDNAGMQLEYVLVMESLEYLYCRMNGKEEYQSLHGKLPYKTMIQDIPAQSLLYSEESALLEINQIVVAGLLGDPADWPSDFMEFASRALRDVIIRYLSKQILNGEKIGWETYRKYMPDKAEMLLMIHDMKTRVYLSIERYIVSSMMIQYFKGVKKYQEKANEDKYKEQLESIEALNRENTRLKQDNKALQDKMDNGTEQQIRAMYDDELKDKDREIRSLEKRLQRLTDKYEQLRFDVGEPQIEDEDEYYEIRPEDCDTSLRYVFVLMDWPQMEKNLLEQFPNSMVCRNSEVLLSQKYDLMIFMTGFIGHKTYYAFKGQAKAKGIPYIHINSSNMDRIKIEIQKGLKQ